MTFTTRNNFLTSTLTLLFLAAPLTLPPPADAAPLLEFCEHSSADQQLRASIGTAGCVPLVEKKELSVTDEHTTRESTPQLKIDNLQLEVTTFLQKYNQFLECCRTDLAELQSVEELGNDVNELLTMAQSDLFSEHMKLRGWTIAKLIPPVAKARADLKRLHTKLEAIGNARNQLGQLDYESAAKESRRIQALEDSIYRDFQPWLIPAGPKTGVGIGASPSVGTGIGMTPKTGTGIGTGGTTGADFGSTPKTGLDIGATGPAGFEIGGTGRAGTAVGESSLNTDESTVGSSLPPSSVGSSLPDSTIGSSLGGSTIGSGMKDTSVGSSLGGSSVGSSIQNRGTAPR